MRKMRNPWLRFFTDEAPTGGAETATDNTATSEAGEPATGTNAAEEKHDSGNGSKDAGSEKPSAPSEPSKKDEGDELGEGGKKALESERALRKAAEAEARDARAAVTAAREEADKRIELEKARYRIAAEKGIPAALAERLQGSTAEELAADAEKLAPLLKPAFVPPTDPSQGADSGGDTGGTVESGRALYQSMHSSKKEKK